MAESRTQRRGLGRGLGSLIQSTSAPEDGAPPGSTDAAAPSRRRGASRWSRCPVPPSPRSRSTGSAPTPPSRARSSTTRRWPSSCTRSGRSGCCSRSWSGRPAADPDGSARYELVMGERRWRATQAAGLPVIPAIVRETDDTDMLRDALLENLHRSQLNPLEEAAAYAQLLEDFECTHEELAGPDRPVPSPDLQHHPAAPALARRPAPGRRRRAVGRPRQVPAGGRGPRAAGPAGPAGRRRGHQCPRPRGDRGRRRRGRPGDPEAPARQADRARSGRARRPALGPVRDAGQGRPRPGQGQDHRRVRQPRRPAPDRRHHGPALNPRDLRPRNTTTLAALAGFAVRRAREADRGARSLRSPRSRRFACSQRVGRSLRSRSGWSAGP